jgi:cell division protease FtsH
MKERIIKWMRKVGPQTVLSVALVTGFVSCSVYQKVADAPAAKAEHKTGINPKIEEIKKNHTEWKKSEKDYSDFMKDANSKSIAAAVMGYEGVYVTTKAGAKYFVPDSNHELQYILARTYSRPDAEPFPLSSFDDSPPPSPVWSTLGKFLEYLPTLLLVVFLLGTLRRFRGAGTDFKMTKSDVKFDQVVGATEAKNALKDIQLFLKDPTTFVDVGARPPRGVLLSGAPGTGKTRLAQALAGECECNFIAATASDFSSMWYGVGISRVKKLFQTARENAPCIIFIDEADGLSKRSSTSQGGAAESESNRIINQFLTEMSGFEDNTGVIVIAATNFPENIDAAFKRSGRFDRKIHVNLPSQTDRTDLFKLYVKKIKVAAEPDYAQLGRMTTGLAPADIEYVVNHSALLAARDGAQAVTMGHLMQAIEDCQMGEVNTSGEALSAHERERVAIHEAGHAVIAKLLKTGNVEKVTILPRGDALGVTYVTQSEDKKLHLRSELENRIQMLFGGRCAELVAYGEASSGAGSDLKEASRIALSMVASFGLGDSGNLFSMQALLDMNAQPNLKAAEEESERLLKRLHELCLAHLTRYKPALEDLRDQMLERETITGDDVERAIERVDARLAAKSDNAGTNEPVLNSAAELAAARSATVEQSPASHAGNDAVVEAVA